MLESRAEYLNKLGRKTEAAQAYRALLDRNPDHPGYYEKLIETLEISDDVAARKAIYDEYAQKSPRCDVARRVPLDFVFGKYHSRVTENAFTDPKRRQRIRSSS